MTAKFYESVLTDASIVLSKESMLVIGEFRLELQARRHRYATRAQLR